MYHQEHMQVWSKERPRPQPPAVNGVCREEEKGTRLSSVSRKQHHPFKVTKLTFGGAKRLTDQQKLANFSTSVPQLSCWPLAGSQNPEDSLRANLLLTTVLNPKWLWQSGHSHKFVSPIISRPRYISFFSVHLFAYWFLRSWHSILETYKWHVFMCGVQRERGFRDFRAKGIPNAHQSHALCNWIIIRGFW